MRFNALIPELTVTDLRASLNFYLALGFLLEYERPEDRFAFLSLQGAQLMLEQFHPTGWNVAPLERPYGRGINLQIEVGNIYPLLEALNDRSYPLYSPIKEYRRRVDSQQIVEREFLVQDPDGYLLRFSQYLGEFDAES